MHYRNTNKIIESLIIILITVLTVLVFLYPVLKPIPVGTDATTYLNDARWIIENEAIPNPYQPTYHGSLAYVAPFTSILVVLLHQFTSLDIVFPLFSIYQLLLIAMLVLTSYLVGKIYSRRMSLLYPAALIGSFAIIRLFMGSTVANLLAFIYVNMIYYFIYRYTKHKENSLLVLIFLSLVSIYLSHKYLTAPIFIPTFIIYLFVLFFINKNIRKKVIIKIRGISVYLKILFIVLIGIIITKLFSFYDVILLEAKNSFWKTDVVDKFRGEVLISQYGGYLGQFIFIMAVLGIIIYIFNKKNNLITFKLLPLFWLLVLLILLQTYLLGIDFYFERIVFLAGMFIPLFAAYFFSYAINTKMVNYRYSIIIVSLFFVIVTISGANRVQDLYDKSNRASSSQISALKVIKSIASNNDIVYSNVNVVSETNHDQMVSDCDIVHLISDENKCDKNNTACFAFTHPDKDSSIDHFINNNVKYFLLMKPGRETNAVIDQLAKNYENNKKYTAKYISEDVKLFQLN